VIKLNMQKQWRNFLLALGFFTRIPVPSFIDFQEADLNHSVKYFPLVGYLVGLIGVAAFYISMQVFTHGIALLISMAATIFATGAFHEDGLADSADGLGGGWGREQVLAIMQDSRLGTYGAIALFMVLMAKYQLLTAMHADTVMVLLICAHAFSRLSAVWLMAALPYAKPSGKAKPLATQVSRSDLWVANIFGLLPVLLLLAWIQNTLGNWRATLSFVLLVLATVASIWWWWRLLLKRKIGGYTGDTLGAIQQLSEIMFYLASLAWLQLINTNSV
jgi:adenosylcobinamide-GDP ribazoletransferase